MTAQELFKRYFWVTGAVAVLLSAYFLAKAIGHLVEATALTDAKQAPKIAAAPPSPDKAAPTTRDKNGQAMADRNIFCSACKPVVIDPAATSVPGQTPITSLPLVLIATNVGGDPKYSFATVRNNDTKRQGGYYVDDVIPGAGPVKEIHFRYIDFANTSAGGRIERISLFGEVPAAKPAVVASATEPSPEGPVDDQQAMIDAGVRKIDDSNFEIDRALVDKALANPMAFAKGGRFVPAVKNGKPNGFKVYAIRPSSVFAKLGMSNGDTIHSVNGFNLNSMDEALAVYTKVKESSSLTLQVTRRGKPTTLNYSIK